MKVELLQSTRKQEQISCAAKLLRAGKVIIFPTDTIYGLLADATNPHAIDKVFKIKNRKYGKPFPILISSRARAKKYARINIKQNKHLARIWPGPRTAILEYRKGLAKNAVASYKDHKSVALRVPNSPLILELLEKINRPLAATSANIAGRPYNPNPSRIARVFQKTKSSPYAFVSIGALPKSKPSAIIDLRTSRTRVVRK